MHFPNGAVGSAGSDSPVVPVVDRLGRRWFRNLAVEIALKGVTWLGSYYPFLAFCLLVALQVD